MNLKASFPIRKVWNSITSRGIYIGTKIILALSKYEIMLASDAKFLKKLIALLDFSLLLPLNLSPLILYALFFTYIFVCSIYAVIALSIIEIAYNWYSLILALRGDSDKLSFTFLYHLR